MPAFCGETARKQFFRPMTNLNAISYAEGTKTPWPLVLPSIKEAPVLQDADNPDCYRITGDVKVNRPARGKLYAYVELKNEVNGEPIPCYNAKADGCGGIGSCIFCDVCSQVKGTKKKKKDEELLRIEISGSKFDCDWGLELGLFRNTSVVFCVPKVDAFIKKLNIDRKTWDHFMSKAKGSQTAFMTYYLFEDEPINRMSESDLQRKIDNMQGVLGCHELVMDVFLN
uniref:Uncharacterized protein n=1 Tax=Romanomermis culicivorax TaxID=13658 RepID=A0A915LBN0_ROMCU